MMAMIGTPGTVTVTIDGREYGLSDDTGVAADVHTGPVELLGTALALAIGIETWRIYHDHGSCGRHWHALLGGGRLGPAVRS